MTRSCVLHCVCLKCTPTFYELIIFPNAVFLLPKMEDCLALVSQLLSCQVRGGCRLSGSKVVVRICLLLFFYGCQV
jgi:hypothetical protein